MEFWRDTYQKSEEVQQELRTKVSELEQRLDKSSTSARATSSPLNSRGKRERDRNDVAEGPNDRARKAAKTPGNGLGIENGVTNLDTMASGLNMSEDKDSKLFSGLPRRGDADLTASNFLHDVHMLQRACNGRTVPAEELESRVVCVCLDMRRLIARMERSMHPSTIAQPEGRKRTTRTQERITAYEQARIDGEAETKLTVMARVFPVLLNSLDRLHRMPEGRGFLGQLVHHVISVLRDTLDRLCLLCATEGEEEHAATLGKKKPQGRAGKQIADFLAAPSASPSTNEGSKPTTMLCQLALVTMAALDMNRAVDNDILEGFLFFLLTRVGNLLGGFVFGDDAKENTRALSSSGKSEATVIREAQAPYLLRLLKYAVVLTAKRPTSPTPFHRTSSHKRPLHVRSSHSGHNSISARARLRMQNTLLRGVFGDDATGLGESLQKPFALDIEPLSQKKGKEDPGDVESWFKDEVWKAVGWEVLREAIAWK